MDDAAFKMFSVSTESGRDRTSVKNACGLGGSQSYEEEKDTVE